MPASYEATILRWYMRRIKRGFSTLLFQGGFPFLYQYTIMLRRGQWRIVSLGCENMAGLR